MASTKARLLKHDFPVHGKGPSRAKNTTDSKFTIESTFATAILKHYGGRFATTIVLKGK